MAHPNDPRHRKLIEDVTNHLNSHGFCVSTQTYHDGRIEQRAKQKLSLTFSPTALHIRGAADNLAIHPDDGMALRFEAKTSALTGGGLGIEALPLADHMLHGKRGVLCLYCCATKTSEFGFWAHDLPPVSNLYLPKQFEAKLTAWYESVLPPLFPQTPVVPNIRTMGSNDPYVVIEKEVLRHLPNWRELIDHERKTWTACDWTASLWNKGTNRCPHCGEPLYSCFCESNGAINVEE